MTDRATLLATINASPLIQSLLYDLGLMPEELEAGTADDRRMIKIVVLVSHLEDVIDGDSAEIATLRTQVAAGDALLVVVNEYYDESDCEDERLDDAMGRAITAYDAAKGVKP